jgi:hypothetical protein
MIIAIDETGTFNYYNDKKLRHMFVSALIQSSGEKLEIKRRQFEKWEATIGQNNRAKSGEVKGSSLSTKDLQNFLLHVMLPPPTIRFSCVSIIPEMIEIDLLNKHKNFEVLLANQALKSQTYLSKKEANFIKSLGLWLNKRNEIEYTKMFCLKHSLMNSLSHAFIHSVTSNIEMEFLDLEFKIDQDFINNENIYWKEYSLKSIAEYSHTKPFPILDTWDENHPIVKKYIINGKGINLRTVFKDQLAFLDSKENFEIRIADIVGIILNRYFNNNSPENSTMFELLENMRAVKVYHTELRLNDFDKDKTFFDFTGSNII